MAIYRSVSMNFWTDSKVDDDFTPEEKYFMLYLLTNPHTNICGCYEISMKQMSQETGYNTDTISRLINRMQETHGVIRYDADTKEILIVKWYKYNWQKSEKVRKAVTDAAANIKSASFKAYIYDTVYIQYGYRMDINTVTVTDTVSDTVSVTESMDADEPRQAPAPEQPVENLVENQQPVEKPKQKKRFVPPTVEEVAAYCAERRNGVNPQRFVDFYTANGWTQGKGKPIKDWQAAVRTWEQRDGYSQARGMPTHSSINMQDVGKIFGQSSSIDMDDVAKLINQF